MERALGRCVWAQTITEGLIGVTEHHGAAAVVVAGAVALGADRVRRDDVRRRVA
jgi:hypothetical protein